MIKLIIRIIGIIVLSIFAYIIWLKVIPYQFKRLVKSLKKLKEAIDEYRTLKKRDE